MRYDFKCPNCNKKFSIQMSMKEYDGTYKCECGSIATKDYDEVKPINYNSHFDGAYGRPL